MIRRNLLGAVFVAWALCSGPATAQNVTCATRPPGDSSNACASTAFVQGTISTPLLTQGYIFVGNASNVASAVNGTNSLVAGGTGGLTAFSNIITGQNYGMAMTNTGEAYGYSFRNSTTTGNDIYSAIYPGVSNQDGIQSVLNIPNTATLGSHGSAISAYFDSNVAAGGGGNNAVGLFSTGRCIATSSACFGLNTLLMDASTRTAGSGTGRYLIGAEYDFNVMNTGTQVIGVSVGGNSLSQPLAANAFITNTLGTGIKWDTAFYSQDGVANQAFVAGASAASGTSVASQPIWLQYFNGSGTKKKVTLDSITNTLRIKSDDASMLVAIGIAGTNSGSLSLAGSTSGTVTLQPQATAGTPTITWGTSTGTPVVTASAPLAINTTTGNISVTGAAGQVLAGATPAFTATPTLGASGTLGSLTLGNATSGLLTLQPVTGALGTVTVSLPAATDTLVGKATTDTLTNKTIDTAGPNTIKINGNTLSASSGTATITVPNTTSTLASLGIAGQTITGGANVTAQSQSTGNITVDCGSRPLQYITNGGAYTITAPSNDGSCILLVTNNASAGATSFSGFSVGSNTGDTLTTTNTSKFSIFIWRINGTSGYRIAAHQ